MASETILPYSFSSTLSTARDGMVRSGDGLTIIKENFIDFVPYLNNQFILNANSARFGLYRLDNGTANLRGILQKISGGDFTTNFEIANAASDSDVTRALQPYDLGAIVSRPCYVSSNDSGGGDAIAWVHRVTTNAIVNILATDVGTPNLTIGDKVYIDLLFLPTI